MKKNILLLMAILLMVAQLYALARNWKSRFITSDKAYCLSASSSYREENSAGAFQTKRPGFCRLAAALIGIHFRTDNEVGIEMGRKIGGETIDKVKSDEVDDELMLVNQKKTATKTQ